MKKKTKKEEVVGWTVTVPVTFPSHRELLKFLRERAGLTQAKLGRKVKMTQVSIARIENSKRLPRLSTLFKLAEACGFFMNAPDFACKKCGKLVRDCKCKTRTKKKTP